jgi:hypothetical protein
MESVCTNPLSLGKEIFPVQNSGGQNGESGIPREIQLVWKWRIELCIPEVLGILLMSYPQVLQVTPLIFLLAPSALHITVRLVFITYFTEFLGCGAHNGCPLFRPQSPYWCLSLLFFCSVLPFPVRSELRSYLMCLILILC